MHSLGSKSKHTGTNADLSNFKNRLKRVLKRSKGKELKKRSVWSKRDKNRRDERKRNGIKKISFSMR